MTWAYWWCSILLNWINGLSFNRLYGVYWRWLLFFINIQNVLRSQITCSYILRCFRFTLFRVSIGLFYIFFPVFFIIFTFILFLVIFFLIWIYLCFCFYCYVFCCFDVVGIPVKFHTFILKYFFNAIMLRLIFMFFATLKLRWFYVAFTYAFTALSILAIFTFIVKI